MALDKGDRAVIPGTRIQTFRPPRFSLAICSRSKMAAPLAANLIRPTSFSRSDLDPGRSQRPIEATSTIHCANSSPFRPAPLEPRR